MSGNTIGYIRVSTTEQNTDRQLAGIEAADVRLDKVFTDRVSGKDTNRPELKGLLEFARDGDTIVVYSMDRLARNLDDLRRLVDSLTKRGVKLRFIKENLTFSGEDNPMSVLLLSVMGAFAEFERALIKERQLEGIALAKERGVYKGGKKKLTPEQETELLARVAAGEKKARIARDLGVGRETVYRYLREHEKA